MAYARAGGAPGLADETAAKLADGAFWQASWFSLRFGVVTAVLECVLGLSMTAYKSIPLEMRAVVDGARPWRLFWKIEFPLMLPNVFVALFIRFIDGFRVIDTIYTLAGGAGWVHRQHVDLYP